MLLSCCPTARHCSWRWHGRPTAMSPRWTHTILVYQASYEDFFLSKSASAEFSGFFKSKDSFYKTIAIVHQLQILQHLQPCGIMVKCLCGFFGPQVQSSHLYLADACLGCADCERLEEELHQREDWSHSVRSLESLCRTLRCWISSQSSWVLRGSPRLPFDAILQYFLLYIYIITYVGLFDMFCLPRCFQEMFHDVFASFWLRVISGPWRQRQFKVCAGVWVFL